MEDKKNKKGPLSNMEKYSIKGMLSEGKGVEEIAEIIGRTKSMVEKHIGEIDKIASNIAKAKLDSIIPEDMYEKAFKIMKSYNINAEDCKSMLNKTIKKITEKPENAEALSRLALMNMSSANLMGKETGGGNDGVRVMTGAASERADSERKKSRGYSRILKGSIHKSQ